MKSHARVIQLAPLLIDIVIIGEVLDNMKLEVVKSCNITMDRKE